MDKTAICNQALLEAEVDKTITSVETDSSIEAGRMRRIYAPTKEECLTAGEWTFATKYIALSPIEKTDSSPYSNTFSYPSQALRVLSVFTDDNAVKANEPILDMAEATTADGSSKIICCDAEQPIALCIVDVKDELLPPAFCHYFYVSLALKFAKISGASNDIKNRLNNEKQQAFYECGALNATVANNRIYDSDVNYYVDVRG